MYVACRLGQRFQVASAWHFYYVGAWGPNKCRWTMVHIFWSGLPDPLPVNSNSWNIIVGNAWTHGESLCYNEVMNNLYIPIIMYIYIYILVYIFCYHVDLHVYIKILMLNTAIPCFRPRGVSYWWVVASYDYVYLQFIYIYMCVRVWYVCVCHIGLAMASYAVPFFAASPDQVGTFFFTNLFGVIVALMAFSRLGHLWSAHRVLEKRGRLHVP